MLQYRGDVILWTITEAITPLIALAIWLNVTRNQSGNITSQDTLTYYILIMLIITATNSWVSYFLTDEILNGELVKFLIRPLSVFWQYIADSIIVKSVRLIIPLPAFMIVSQVFPHLFSASIYHPSKIALAIVSILLGAAIAFVLDAILSSLAFWIEDVHQILGYQYLLWTIGSGVLIPFVFLPTLAQKILTFLPYRYIVSAPIEILVPAYSHSQPGNLIIAQLLWLSSLIIFLNIIWRKGLKRYAIPGQ